MNDYFLENLIRQRHEQILTEVRAVQLSQLGRSCVANGKKMIRQLILFLSRSKRNTFFQPPATDEGKSV
ncbi:MAG: hypothetical protein HKO68_15210 [Desulfobacterales bacterium]|nr:hypothetical protein [Desulfobacterales bacterium]